MSKLKKSPRILKPVPVVKLIPNILTLIGLVIGVSSIRFALDSKKYDGFIALGCVIRGETTHYDYVCGESARGLMELATTHKAAIGYGILTVETIEQAMVRASIHQGNKGKDAAEACLRLIELKKHYAA